MLFQPFRKATQRQTPDFSQAAAQQGQLENDAKARRDALVGSNMIGGATVYNEAMGDNTPITDWLDEAFGGAEAATAVGDLSATTMTGADIAAMGAPAEMVAEQAAVNAAGAGGEGFLASMGPMGWAALAALALANFK